MHAANKRLTNTLVILGIICSLGLMVLSAMVNYRVGFKRADTDLDGYIYGIGLALADVLKALTPFYVAYAWRHRMPVGVVLGSLFFATVTLASLQSGLEFASELRSVRDASRTTASTQRTQIANEIGEIEKSLAAMGPVPAPAEIQASIDEILARPIGRSTVGAVSTDCTVMRPATRQECLEIAGLKVKHARSEEREARSENLAKLRKALQDMGSAGVGSVDPQLDSVKGVVDWLGGVWKRDDIRLALVILVGLVFEFGSGAGLYLSTLPWTREEWRSNEPVRGPAPPAPLAAAPVPQIEPPIERLGDVEQYMVERMTRRAKTRTAIGLFHSDYVDWCTKHRLTPLAGEPFAQSFRSLCDEVGIEIVGEGMRANVQNARFGSDHP